MKPVAIAGLVFATLAPAAAAQEVEKYSVYVPTTGSRFPSGISRR